MAGCEGLSHTGACQRWRRGPAQPSGTVAREAETQTNPLAPLRLAGGEMRSTRSIGEFIISVRCWINYPDSASTLICITAFHAPNMSRSNISNHFSTWCLCVFFMSVKNAGQSYNLALLPEMSRKHYDPLEMSAVLLLHVFAFCYSTRTSITLIDDSHSSCALAVAARGRGRRAHASSHNMMSYWSCMFIRNAEFT